MSTRKHVLLKAPRYRLTDRERRILAAAWNGYVRRGLRISLRPFARMHALAAACIDAETPITNGNFCRLQRVERPVATGGDCQVTAPG